MSNIDSSASSRQIEAELSKQPIRLLETLCSALKLLIINIMQCKL